ISGCCCHELLSKECRQLRGGGAARRLFRAAPSCEETSSGLLDLRGLLAAAFSVVHQDESDLITLVERPDARGFQSRGVDEYVLGAVFRRDKAKALGAVEELDCSSNSHGKKPFR